MKCIQKCIQPPGNLLPYNGLFLMLKWNVHRKLISAHTPDDCLCSKSFPEDYYGFLKKFIPFLMPICIIYQLKIIHIQHHADMLCSFSCMCKLCIYQITEWLLIQHICQLIVICFLPDLRKHAILYCHLWIQDSCRRHSNHKHNNIYNYSKPGDSKLFRK